MKARIINHQMNHPEKAAEDSRFRAKTVTSSNPRFMEMKTSLSFLTIFLAVHPTLAASTNDLASALQKGLFEEEANHNFPAAIEAYQGVINRFDEDRKLAATAIFRVGEIYRKQGKTNEANAQYERVAREFSDQSTIATLSQSYLAVSANSLTNSRTTNTASEPALTSDEAEEVKKIRAMIRDSPDLINAKDQVGNTPLLRAADLGQLIVARFLVENGADVNANNGAGQTALNFAAFRGHKALVELLLSHDANVDLANSDGSTPLHAASQRGFRSIVEVLLARGANVNAKARWGSTPLHLAVANGFKSVAEFLLSHGADVNSLTFDIRDEQQKKYYGTPLHIATTRADRSLAELLLANKANPNATNSNGDTPLHIAAQLGDPNLAELLLANKAAVDAVNNAGETPLDLAAKQGRIPIVAALLSHGADINARNPMEGAWKGWTPLLYTVGDRHTETAALLLKNKADPNARFESPNVSLAKGTTSLLMAASRGDREIISSLLDSKADPNLKDDYGSTATFWAMGVADPARRKEIESLLLDHGAEIEARDREGNTLLMLAAGRKDKEIVDLLLAHKAEVNAKNPRGNTALNDAILSFNSAGGKTEAVADIVEVLLSAGANPNLKSETGSLPIFLAMGVPEYANRKRIIQLLLDQGADVETRDDKGKTLLMRFVEGKDKEIFELLLAHKADVNAKTAHGDTALHFAVSSLNSGPGPARSVPSSFSDRLSRVGSDTNPQPENPRDVVGDIIEALLNAGANVNLQDNDGKTALNILLNPQTSTVVVGPVRDKVIKLLRDHGAVEDLPRLDAIEVRRPESNFSKVIFTKGTNGWDQFTLFDLIGVQYRLLSASPAGDHREIKVLYWNFAPGTGLDFPDFKRIRIRHPKPDFKDWSERTVDIDSVLAAGDCSADTPLQMGDQVEIPEADHVLNAGWEGFSTNILKNFQKCLVRNISVIVKGQSHSISLGPDLRLAGTPDRSIPGSMRGNAEVLQFAPIMIKPALIDSRLLLASSDLSRIKLIRADSATGQKRELIVDCSPGAPAPSVWLRDGDIIEVPDKP